MIAVRPVLSTSLLTSMRRRARVLVAMFWLASCAAPAPPQDVHPATPPVTDGYFVMPDGTRLPYRTWMPSGKPWAVVLALHGMNDSRDAWEYPAPDLARAGIAVFAPDQWGFGAAPRRGRWAGTATMVDDARHMAMALHQRYPDTKLILLGESMGAAVLMLLAAEPDPPPANGYVLVSPAVWGRVEMNMFLRVGLWFFSNAFPDVRVTGRGFVHIVASDNRAAIRRLGDDPLTIHATRWDTIRGLVNLMDDALAAAPEFRGRALFLYGGHDELIPKRAAAATWRALSPEEREAFYPAGYHLLLRDHERITPIEDIMSWIRDPNAPLPSGADRAAAAWLAKQPPTPGHVLEAENRGGAPREVARNRIAVQ
jgi:acylglycerol lipase